jgi:WD40 repeat protein
MFASCSADRTVKYFSCDKKKGAYVYVSSTELVSMPITAIDFNLDGTLLCTAGNEILKIWDMRKNGLLIESIDSAWRGVQDVLWCEKGIKGLSSYGGSLSVWFCYLGDQM